MILDVLAIQYGRDGDDIHFYQGLSFVVGETEEEARRKEIELENKIDLEMMIAHLAGAIGIDLGNVSLDTPLENIETDGTRSLVDWVSKVHQEEPLQLKILLDSR